MSILQDSLHTSSHSRKYQTRRYIMKELRQVIERLETDRIISERSTKYRIDKAIEELTAAIEQLDILTVAQSLEIDKDLLTGFKIIEVTPEMEEEYSLWMNTLPCGLSDYYGERHAHIDQTIYEYTAKYNPIPHPTGE